MIHQNTRGIGLEGSGHILSEDVLLGTPGGVLRRMLPTLWYLEGDVLLMVEPLRCPRQVLGTSEVTRLVDLLLEPEGSHTTGWQRSDCVEKDPGSKNPVHHDNLPLSSKLKAYLLILYIEPSPLVEGM